ncbi:hypothetical protein Psi01_29060 [Planobispora siamensis]|uniref:DUF664 domain-containing protein n=1 Tax=Planobispora siamensis TaxID=936338 RepID=A0A8J3SCR3_9ACTN|nr:hypothetical protein Psi01_29060 [Planobispora siamensis]
MDGTSMNGERADLLRALARHRGFLRQTVRGLTDEEAALRTTASELCLGGLIKHVAGTEAKWMRFAAGGAVVRAGRALVGAPGPAAHHRRDRPARRARRHHPRVPGRRQDHGLTARVRGAHRLWCAGPLWLRDRVRTGPPDGGDAGCRTTAGSTRS